MGLADATGPVVGAAESLVSSSAMAIAPDENHNRSMANHLRCQTDALQDKVLWRHDSPASVEDTQCAEMLR
jgi:hypothetical protein